jgi:hypothetical protein
VKGNFHARFGIGGGEGDLSADHTTSNVEHCCHSINGGYALFLSMNMPMIVYAIEREALPQIDIPLKNRGISI